MESKDKKVPFEEAVIGAIFDWEKRPIPAAVFESFPEHVRPYVEMASVRATALAKEHVLQHDHPITWKAPTCCLSEAIVNLYELIKSPNLTEGQRENIIATAMLITLPVRWFQEERQYRQSVMASLLGTGPAPAGGGGGSGGGTAKGSNG